MTAKPASLISSSLTTKALDPSRRGSKFQQNIDKTHSVGAIYSFVGLVRSIGQQGQPIDVLELEHYPGMTETKLRQIAGYAAQNWQLIGIDVCHRIGPMCPGDVIVHVIVGASHRQKAYEACGYVVEQLKSEIPLWKKEIGNAGATWVTP